MISDNLVSFRSVTELQQQNQKLLCVVRELSEEQERREVEEEDPKVRVEAVKWGNIRYYGVICGNMQ